jgi:hypothetical protein
MGLHLEKIAELPKDVRSSYSLGFFIVNRGEMVIHYYGTALK